MVNIDASPICQKGWLNLGLCGLSVERVSVVGGLFWFPDRDCQGPILTPVFTAVSCWFYNFDTSVGPSTVRLSRNHLHTMTTSILSFDSRVIITELRMNESIVWAWIPCHPGVYFLITGLVSCAWIKVSLKMHPCQGSMLSLIGYVLCFSPEYWSEQCAYNSFLSCWHFLRVSIWPEVSTITSTNITLLVSYPWPDVIFNEQGKDTALCAWRRTTSD